MFFVQSCQLSKKTIDFEECVLRLIHLLGGNAIFLQHFYWVKNKIISVSSFQFSKAIMSQEVNIISKIIVELFNK